MWMCLFPKLYTQRELNQAVKKAQFDKEQLFDQVVSQNKSLKEELRITRERLRAYVEEGLLAGNKRPQEPMNIWEE